MTQQTDLFQYLPVDEAKAPALGIAGMTYVPDFLDPNEQEVALREVDQQPWSNELKRRVQHYGYRYDYKARRVDASMRVGALPAFAMPIAARLVERDLFTVMPDQLIVNEYEPGQGITAHIDCEPCFGERVAMVSLGWAYEMDFIHSQTRHRRSILLAVGSALIISSEARYQWLHQIKARMSDRGIPRKRRVSLTFRTVILAP